MSATPVSYEPTPVSRLCGPVLVADRRSTRVRRTRDLIDTTLALLAIVLVIFIGAFAQSTTVAVTEDVRSALSGVLRQILLLPLTLVESVVVLAAPIFIIVQLAIHGRLRQIVETIITTTVTALLMTALISAGPHLPSEITGPLTITSITSTYLALDTLIAVLAAFLTSASEASESKAVRYTWIFLYAMAFIYVLRGTLTLPSALVTLLIGRAIGLLSRYVLGYREERGGPTDLVDGLLQIGITPTRIVRADLDTEQHPLETTIVTEKPGDQTSWSAAYLPLIENPEAAAEHDLGTLEFNTLKSLAAESDRHYVCWDTTGSQYDLIVLDPDTEYTSLIHDLWSNIRLKNLSRWIAPSLQATAERGLLVKISAHNAGVMTPKPIAVTSAGSSVFTVQEPVFDATPLTELPAERITDQILDRFYTELKRAHHRGIAHRSITTTSLAVDEGDRTWILGWDEGQVATSNVNRHIDIAQMLTVLALITTPERALASANRVFGQRTLQLTAPVLQKVALPAPTRAKLRRSGLLNELRQNMIGEIPPQQVPETPLTRFSLKTVILAIIGVIALWVILGSLNFEAVYEAVQTANPWWILGAFALGLLTYVGAAMPLSWFVPEKLHLRETTLVQIGASVVSLVAPAGIGPAALNLRYLNKRGVSTPVGLATVALIQFTQFATTVITLLLIILVTGRSTTLEIPSGTLVYVIGTVVTIVAIILVIPKLRNMIWEKIQPSWNQIWERLVWVASQPKRLAIGVLGNLVMTVSYVAAFGASLAAFGYSLDVTTLAITFLASTSLGSVIPAPGGIGPVEAALTAGLTVAGIPSGIAISTALVYRLVTFYARAPLGWIALRILQRRNLI
ncbi:lysylphosphatidylglycerol synthase transmembrane domain-containing protein [Actinomyces sp.]|uniref:lysylphosphatidylglycerol synthase transmembrane domain-containing protein n=1 Tax=Actinomyces sp. TaxID=29317 RepID=UPI00290CBC52|nr:lysylphosphatidylglycerol synthase transmembrane domain-containing protein [Actinomyces sp.]MDU4287330.1 lysylphosphatidylglycerol synthase transmembrane domain-containing protein [Actinomyces sp.]MDU7239397.1 lysylphosphatidylglycerol synthase transmembrane domain-containing protein [Actinomyces sp.]